jgi:hypothetical protein
MIADVGVQVAGCCDTAAGHYETKNPRRADPHRLRGWQRAPPSSNAPEDIRSNRAKGYSAA